MRDYVIKRFLQMIVVIVAVIFVSFIIIELPPGDFLSSLRQQLQEQNVDPQAAEATVQMYKEMYGLDDQWYVRLGRWVSALAHGDLGYSMQFNKSNAELIGSRMQVTLAISLATLIFMMAVAIPIGMLSAIKQYSIWDNTFTVLAFIGVATPGFIMALVLLFVTVIVFKAKSVGGLFSPEYMMAAWSWPRFVDMLKHVWIILIIVGLGDTASTIRIMRARMLDTLGEPYIETARMKGLSSIRVYTRHALRVAINPIISSIGLRFPSIISGSTIVAIVLSLPMIGPLQLQALRVQDMYLAVDILLMLTVALIIGNFLADLALAWLDPRIRYD
jgi:peptide/nickel transport system permease protein